MSASSKRKYQKRGRERREHIIRNALELLRREELDKLSLADIAARAEVPLSSLYHFFPDINSLWAELIPVFYGELLVHWRDNLPSREYAAWPELLTDLVHSTVDFYRARPEYMQLILAGRTPAYFKFRQTQKGDFAVRAMQRGLGRLLNVHVIPDRHVVYGNVFQIIEHFLTLSVIRDNEITDLMVREACRAGIAYLSLYLAPYASAETMDVPDADEAEHSPADSGA